MIKKIILVLGLHFAIDLGGGWGGGGGQSVVGESGTSSVCELESSS